MGSSRPPEVDRIWLWVYCNKLPIYPIYSIYLRGTRLDNKFSAQGFGLSDVAFRVLRTRNRGGVLCNLKD